MARAAFLEEQTPLHGTAGWNQIAAAQPDWPRTIDGYNLCYLRDEATAACISADSYQAPLISFWNRGAGRVAAVTLALGGPFGQSVQNWEGYGDLVQTLSRWLNRQDAPPGYSVRTETAGDRLFVHLYYSEENIPQMARQMPEITVELAGPGRYPHHSGNLGASSAGSLPVQLPPASRNHGARRRPA